MGSTGPNLVRLCAHPPMVCLVLHDWIDKEVMQLWCDIYFSHSVRLRWRRSIITFVIPWSTSMSATAKTFLLETCTFPSHFTLAVLCNFDLCIIDMLWPAHYFHFNARPRNLFDISIKNWTNKYSYLIERSFGLLNHNDNPWVPCFIINKTSAV
jgi:hypothetical protein